MAKSYNALTQAEARVILKKGTEYPGTGEYTTGSTGGGLLRSLDAGATWSVVASNAVLGPTCSGVAVVSGKIRGLTATMPITVEMLYNEYASVAAFTLAAVLALLALVTLALKTLLEWRYADQLAATHRH